MPTPSCDQCHRRRIHCVGGKPACEHCRATGQICTYSTGRPVGKPKGHRKVKRNTSTEIQPNDQTENSLAHRRLDSTTSDSSPSYSDVNDVGNASYRDMRPSAAAVATRSPLNSVPTTLSTEQMTPISTFTSPYSSSPEVEFNSMRIAGNKQPQPQQANMDPAQFTMGLDTSMPTNTTTSADMNYFEWQGLPQYPPATIPLPFGSPCAPFFDPATSKDLQHPLLQPPFIYTSSGDSTGGLYMQDTMPGHQWQRQPLPQNIEQCYICQQLPGVITSLFRCQFDSQSNFDTILTQVHNALEGARKSLECAQCLTMREQRPMVFVMLLQQALNCCQRMLSIGLIDSYRPYSHMSQPGERSSGETYPLHIEGFENETADLQTSVRVSVAQMEVGKLRQLLQNVRFLLLERSASGDERLSVETLLVALDDALGTLQQGRYPSLL